MVEIPEMPQLLIEHRFDLSSLYPGMFGTADAVIWDPRIKLLKVMDYKHGAGIPVEVVNNPQLQYYALGAMISLQIPFDATVETVIVQPRCEHHLGPIRSHKFPATDLLGFANRLVISARRTEDPNAPLVSGKHCHFCPAKPHCPELHGNALELAKTQFSQQLPYNPRELSKALTWLPQLESWIDGVKEFAHREAQAGRVPPGFKLVPKRANRRWVKNPIPDLERLGLKTQDLLEIPSVKSPAQIEKLLPKGQKHLLEELVIKESSGEKLVPSDEEGDPILRDPKSVFAVVEQS